MILLNKFRETIHKFIEWICVNFDMGTGDTLVRDFERETRTCLDGEEQIKREDKENERNVQITILVAFWILMFDVGILIEHIKKLYSKRKSQI